MARVYPLKETTNDPSGNWQLWFQWCRYDLEDGIQHGYRFIWRWPTGQLQAARGQARIPSVQAARDLMEKAVAEGWGDRDGDTMAEAIKRLEEHGCVVSLSSGYVGWPSKEVAISANPSPELLEDARLVQSWS